MSIFFTLFIFLMTYNQSIILGIVQGLGEFLPISSSGHLVVVPWIFGFKDPGLSFDVALHLGTLLALMFYFWKDWWNLLKGSCRPSKNPTQFRFLFYLVIATIPGALVGLFFDEIIETYLRHPILVAVNMSLLGVILLISELKGTKQKKMGEVSLLDGALIGVAQCLALVPGVSRAGITMTAGLLRGFDRVTAARFSFLIAAPITLGACILKVPDLISQGITGEIIVGIVVSAVVGFLSIKYLLKFVINHSYKVFVYYRFVFTIAVVGYYFWLKN